MTITNWRAQIRALLNPRDARSSMDVELKGAASGSGGSVWAVLYHTKVVGRGPDTTEYYREEIYKTLVHESDVTDTDAKVRILRRHPGATFGW